MSLPKVNHSYALAKPLEGVPTQDNFKLVESELPAPQAGQFLVKVSYLSVDPYMRSALGRAPIGTIVPTFGAGVVVSSQNEKFPVGTSVSGMLAWQEYVLSSGKDLHVVPSDVPLSLTIGTLGMPGATAYFGLLEICKPKAGETVFVTGAAGAVGLLVGQIAKIKGCKVIGSAGGPMKCKFCKDSGFDEVIDYKDKSYAQLKAELDKVAPQGIDCFFENTGGPMSAAVMQSMNTLGRVAVCGMISMYNTTKPEEAGILFPMGFIYKQISVEGFICNRWASKWPEAHAQIYEWIKEKKVTVKEDIVQGFGKVIDAFIGLFKGTNTGKMVIQL